MKFSEQPPSEQWAALKYRGEKLAEVWFKPEGEPFSIGPTGADSYSKNARKRFQHETA
jgi:hypothetical protein